MKQVPKVANRAVLDSTVSHLENAQNVLMDSTKVKKNKPPVSSVSMVDHRTLEEPAAKKLITK